MKASLSALNIRGTVLDGENPLPMLRDREADKQPKLLDRSEWPPEKLEHFGELNGFKVLPYTMLDRYDRTLRPVRHKTVVLENELLRAEFLLGFGGRLHSLRDKTTGKELLFRNPVLQIGNIAIRNAWITGGVEWNFGRIGHTYFTSAPVFCALLHDDTGNQFVRIYEYERMKETSWQLDFHLPSGSRILYAHGRIVNDTDHSIPLYWWSDMAIDEVPGLRVLSGSDTVSYITPSGEKLERDPLEGKPSPYKFGYCKLEEASRRFCFDITYPEFFKTSDDYFYQGRPEDQAPWISAVYPDGRVFFNRSTRTLINRKMFCWGTHNGGRKWCDHLSEDGKGYFAEIQSGMATSQNHMRYLPAGEILEWTEAFSDFVLQNPQDAFVPGVEEAKAAVFAEIDRLLPAGRLEELDRTFSALSSREPDALLSLGSGFGALDRMLREKEGRTLPAGLLYPDCSLSEKELPWLHLLQHGFYPETAADRFDPSFMTDSNRWLRLLEESLQTPEGGNHSAWMQYGVMLYEAGRYEEALSAWQTSLSILPTAISCRNLAYGLQMERRAEEAEAYMEQAFALGGLRMDQAFSEEYLKMLVFHKHYQKAWDFYCTLDPGQATDKALMYAAHAAVKTGHEDFVLPLFEKELQNMREGDTDMTDLWFEYHAVKEARRRGVPCTQELIDEMERTLEVPAFIDYRIV